MDAEMRSAKAAVRKRDRMPRWLFALAFAALGFASIGELGDLFYL
jgi:hypothetical protein